MTRIIYNFAVRVRNLVVHEFPLLLAAVVAALSAVTGQSAKAYVVAAGVAALRFVVSPAFESAMVKAKVTTPTIDEKIEAAVEGALARYVPASVAPTTVAVDTVPVVDPAV